MLVALAAACTRSSSNSAGNGTSSTQTTAKAANGATALDSGGFGDLSKVCSPGTATGATAKGVSNTEINVGTVTDKGFAGVQGLNKEMYDAAVAFTTWCNEHGGISGRKLVLHDLDAKLLEYEARITESCERDFALVGGGAVFDEDAKNLRVGCGLANIAGFVVSARGRVADLQVQPVPNPVYSLPVGGHLRVAALHPDAIAHYGVMTSTLPSVRLVRDQAVEGAKSAGYTLVSSIEYAPTGETGWQTFVQELKSKGVRILEFIGQPEGLTSMTKAMDTEGWSPDVILVTSNFYDEKFAAEAGDTASKVLIRSTYFPFELAKDNKATQDYLTLMERYNKDGKVALLGTQGISAWLLFATAAAACGSNLTQACLIEKAGATTRWTGGGLHSAQTPGNATAGSCFLLMTVSASGFAYAKDLTKPNDGLFNCDAANVATLTADYGVPKPTK